MAQIVDWAREILQGVLDLPAREYAQFASLVKDAAGFAIFPRVVKRGVILAEISGRGVLVYRESDGSWSWPILLQLKGQSLGPQMGVMTSDVLVVFKTVDSLRRLDAGNGVVPGVQDASVTAYQTNRGLILGQSVDRTALYLDTVGNTRLYGNEVAPGPIAQSLRARLKPPPCVQKMSEQLNLWQAKPPVTADW